MGDNMKDMFYCKYKFTDKCVDKEKVDCDNCFVKACNQCENSWSSNVCGQCKHNLT
jgi:hypothetical protein